MDTAHLKQLLDACFLAKRVVETMPELPEGMKPRHIHVLEIIHEKEEWGEECRVSDVSARLGTTTPSITKLVQELESMKMLVKRAGLTDRRVTVLRLTEKGKRCVRLYVLDLHRVWAEALWDIPDSQAEQTAELMERLYDSMPGREAPLSYSKKILGYGKQKNTDTGKE